MNKAMLSNYALCSLSALGKTKQALGRPIALTIEPTNVCNLKCSVCETGAGIMRRPKGFMSLNQFEAILSNVGKQVNTLLFYFMGEPFLNKEAYDMIAEARKRGIYVSVCTNSEFVNAKQLVESGVNEVNFQFDGFTLDTFGKYRVGADYRVAYGNLLDFLWQKKGKPIKAVLGMIVMRHNEQEVKSFKGIPYLTLPHLDRYDIINPCVRTIEQGKEFLPSDDEYWIYDREAFESGILKPKKIPHNRCWWIYYSTVVCWNGDVVPCCRDAQGDYVMGNALEQDFGEIWNGTKYREFRGAIATRQNSVALCHLCSGYGVPRLR